jgi:hypothetical protein
VKFEQKKSPRMSFLSLGRFVQVSPPPGAYAARTAPSASPNALKNRTRRFGLLCDHAVRSADFSGVGKALFSAATPKFCRFRLHRRTTRGDMCRKIGQPHERTWPETETQSSNFQSIREGGLALGGSPATLVGPKFPKRFSTGSLAVRSDGA